MPLDTSPRPVFARCLARSAAISERKGADGYRRRLLAGLAGRVIEVGAGTGINFRHYPRAVAEVLAVEPEPNLRAMAEAAAHESPVPVRVVAGTAEALPAPDGSIDAGVSAGLLCSVPDPAAALTELSRVIRPGGELRFYEHVISRRRRAALLQRGLDASGLWKRAMGGCRTSRDTEAAIAHAGFDVPVDRALYVPPHAARLSRRAEDPRARTPRIAKSTPTGAQATLVRTTASRRRNSPCL